MRYYIGVDGGGTKTAICAANVGQSLLRYTKTSGTSWREHGALEVARRIKEVVYGLIGGGEIAGIAMGLPCYGESAEGDNALKQAIQKEFSDISAYLTNDVEIGWAGSMALKPGINIVAGTGSICFGKDIHGKAARSGGWSEFFGDEGSCYWVGRKTLELFSKQADGRMPKDELYDIVYREFGIQDDFGFIDIIHDKYMGNRKQVASLQFLAEKAALSGSTSAVALYNEAVQELCQLVTAVRNQLDFAGNPFQVSYSGGLFKAGEFVLPQFSQEIENMGGTLSPPRFKPEEGAVLLACQHFCQNDLTHVQEVIQNSNNR
ncbi:MAG: ATPase [Oscillospiraceae bacterium]|nr:ATPase [Oscillospiraceae bacterium]